MKELERQLLEARRSITAMRKFIQWVYETYPEHREEIVLKMREPCKLPPS